ncbi:MAG: RluA family pseudouridine synthase [Candidatus Omnitrophica bacterium]|nr:RluA family pseudouridine synthase [Candidatus Omnitrophota bacterium]
MQEYLLKVSSEHSGMRIDQFLAKFCQTEKLGVSRTKIQKAICKGSVKINGVSQRRPNYKVREAEEVSFVLEDIVENRQLKAEDIPLEVVYEDSDIAVINKPSGMVVHPGAGNTEHTLVNALLSRFKNLSDVNPQRPGIIHRLDKETSGLLVIAKNNNAHFALSKQFSEHSIKRKYIAVVRGRMEFDEDVIEVPIGRHPRKRKNMSVSFAENAKYARTRYTTLKRTDNFSLLELEPFTGRTHQLRVHLAFIGHPILGDKKYGKGDTLQQLFLHAQYLGFIHPVTGKFMDFSSHLPSYFQEFLI